MRYELSLTLTATVLYTRIPNSLGYLVYNIAQLVCAEKRIQFSSGINMVTRNEYHKTNTEHLSHV